MLKLSFTTMATPNLSGIEAIKLAKAFGYNGVDLRVSPQKGELTLDSPPQQIKELKDAFTSEGMKPSGLLCYNTKGGEEQSSWHLMEEELLRYLDIASQIGSPSIRIFSGDPRQSPVPDDYIKRTAESVGHVLQKDNTKTVILIQNHRNGFIASDSYHAIKYINNPRFKLVLSPDHCLLENENINTVLGFIKEITGQLYIADLIKPKEPNPPEIVLPGKGDVEIKKVFHALGGHQFNGWVTFKWERIWHMDLPNEQIALPYFIDYVKNLL